MTSEGWWFLGALCFAALAVAEFVQRLRRKEPIWKRIRNLACKLMQAFGG